MKLYSVGRTVSNVVVRRNYHSFPIMFPGGGDWWGYQGKTKPLGEIAPFDHTKRTDCQYKGDFAATRHDIQAPEGVPADQFNPIDGDGPGNSGLGAKIQYEAVPNIDEIPGWYVNFNAWRFRQDNPGGNHTRQGCLSDDMANWNDSDLSAMQDRMYDTQRQAKFYRMETAEQHSCRKESALYEDWSPRSADHKYTNCVGRQLFAEMDEEYVLDHITTGHSKVRGTFLAPFRGYRVKHFGNKKYKAMKANIDSAVLRSQFD